MVTLLTETDVMEDDFVKILGCVGGVGEEEY